jgi:hypothetical protein
MAQRVVFFAADLDLAFREGPRWGGEILGCLGVGRPSKVPLVDAELKRGEDSRQRDAKLGPKLSGTIIRGTLKAPKSQLVTPISTKLQRPDGCD